MEQPSANARALFALATVLCAIGIGAPVVAPEALVSALLRDLAMASTTVLAIGGTLRLPADRQRAWWFVSLGCFAFFLADVSWDVYTFALETEAPLPSYADLANLAAYPLFVLGAFELMRQRTNVDRVNALLDAGTLALALSLVVWEPLLLDVGRSVLGSFVTGAYPVGDIALIGVAAILVGAGRRPTAASLVFLGGAVVLFAADLGYLALRGNGTYSTGAWPDPLFVVGPFLLAAAPWLDHPSGADEAPVQRRPRPVAATMVVVAALVALPIDFGLADSADTQDHETFVRVGLRVALLGFVALRLVRQAAQNQRLVDRLASASTQLSMVIENTADAVIFTDPGGDVREWNAAAERLFARPRSEILGRNALAEFVRPEYADALAGVDLSSGAFTEISLPMLIEGRTIPVTLQIASVRDTAGEVLGFVTVARDDTRRLFARYARQTFARLDPAEAMAQFARDLHAFIPFWSVSLVSVEDETFRELVRIRRSADASFSAATENELLAGALTDVGLGGLGDDSFRITDSLLALPLRDPLTAELRGILALSFGPEEPPTVAHAEALARVAPDLSQSVTNMMLYETQRLHAERLQELDDMRDAFLRMVAHELRSPLGAINTAAGVLRDHAKSLGEDEARELASGIASGARHLSRLTSDLVDATRMGDGRFPCDMRDIDDLGRIVNLAAASAAGDQRDRVFLDVADDVAVRADSDRVAQIVTNLVTNALKFSAGEVEVNLRHDDPDAVITVTDHGPGVPEEQSHLLFQRYARLAPRDGSMPGGSGLGLFITKELVAAHGGSIAQRATAGGGATFEVRLPGARVRQDA